MALDFSNPASGPAGTGLLQNAGGQINWRQAYQQYVMDEQTEGREPLPLPAFMQELSKAAQQKQSQPQPPVQPAPVPAAGGGLMQGIRGLFR